MSYVKTERDKLITQELLHELFDYDHETGLLYNKIHRSPQSRKGMVAGRLNKGYREIGVKRTIWLAHRLIWCYHYGEMPDISVDHINGVRDDNKIENLRLASLSENCWNARIPSHNTSGVKGVYWNKMRNKWVVQLKLFGEMYYFGLYDDINEAEKVVREAREKLHKEFTNHGDQK